MSKICRILACCVALVVTIYSQNAEANEINKIRYMLDQFTQQKNDSAYLVEEVQGRSALTLYFSANQEKCEEAYGKEWVAVCTRPVGDILPRGNAIEISPIIKGSWSWESDSVLAFYPDEDWQANTFYTIKIAESSLPKYTEIKSPIEFKTASLKSIFYGDFKFDPNQYKKRMISGRIDFNYAVDFASVKERFFIKKENEKAKMLLGSPNLHFDSSNRVVYYDIPVLELPEKNENIQIGLKAGVKSTKGTSFAEENIFNVNIPAKSSLFKVISLASETLSLEDLSLKQSLNIQFSLPVDPKEILESIDIYLMPRQRIENSITAKQEAYTWWNIEHINDEILSKSVKLQPTYVGNDEEKSRFISFTFNQDIEDGRFLYLDLKKGIKGAESFILAKDFKSFVPVASLGSDMRIMASGSVMNLKGSQKLALYARNADSIQYNIYQVRPDFINLFLKDGGLSSSSFNNIDTLAELHSGVLPLNFVNAEEAQFSSLDLNPYIEKGKKGVFYVRVSSMRDGKVLQSDERSILITDIGIIHKQNLDASSTLYLVSLSSGEVLANNTVRILGANGLEIFTTKTDEQGIAFIPSLNHLTKEQKPTSIIATRGEDYAFIPYTAPYQRLNSFSIETGGSSHKIESLYGSIFSQRDLYRPGDSLYFGFVLKQETGNTKLSSLPLKISLRDPRGTIIQSKKLNLTKDGLGDAHFTLDKNALTGRYFAFIHYEEEQSEILTSFVQVQEFMPETMRLTTQLKVAEEKAWYTAEELKNTPIESRLVNLYGNVASNHKIEFSASMSPMTFSFDIYKDYSFYDAAHLKSSHFMDAKVKTTDEYGKVESLIPNDFYQNSSGLIKVKTQSFNAFGEASVDAQTHFFVSPLKAIIGYKTSSYLNYIPQNAKAQLSIISIDAFLNPYNYGEVNFEIYDVEYVRSLVQNNVGAFEYKRERNEKLSQSFKQVITQQGLDYALDTHESGEKMLLLKDANGRTLLRVEYTIAGDGLTQYGETKNVDLIAKINKKEYNKEDIEIYLNLPYSGTGLISLEREKVYAQKWFTAEKGEQIQKISIPKELIGKGYVHILFYRSMKDEDIFTTPYTHTILPFVAHLDSRRLDLKMSIDDSKDNNDNKDGRDSNGSRELETKNIKTKVVRSGSTLNVELESESPAKALVFAVDQGILQMTGYQSPNILKALYVDKALDVATYQYFDMLMPEYNLLEKHISAFGGGFMMDSVMAKNSASSSFRRAVAEPAVFWSGIIDIETGKETVDIPLPATFSGELKVIALAVAGDKVATQEETVLVQSEVVIEPYFPKYISYGDSFYLNIAWTDLGNKTDKARTWSVKIDAPEAFEVVDGNSFDILLAPQKQKNTRVKINLKNNSTAYPISFGSKEIKIELRSTTGEVITMPVSVLVRPHTVKESESIVGVLKPLKKEGEDEKKQYNAEFSLPNFFSQDAELRFSLSSLPSAYAISLMENLDSHLYPYSIQYASRLLPRLTLLENVSVVPLYMGDTVTEQELLKEINSLMEDLTARYDFGEGFLSFAQGLERTNLFETVFIADILMEAEQKGLYLEARIKDAFFEKVYESLNRLPYDLESARNQAYGAWVLTQNGVITSSILANLITWLDANVKDWKQDIIAPIMAASMKLMMQEETADELMKYYKAEAVTAWSWKYGIDALAERALYLTLVTKHFPAQMLGEESQKTLHSMLELIAQKSSPAPSQALAARALMLYSFGQSKSVFEGDARIFIESLGNTSSITKTDEEKDSLGISLFMQEQEASDVRKVLFEADAPLFYQVNMSGYSKEQDVKAHTEGLEIVREYRNIDGSLAPSIEVGKEYVVAIRAKALSKEPQQVVITDLLAGAFEFRFIKGDITQEISTQDGKLAVDSTEREELDMIVSFVERLEDRLIIYAELGNKETVLRYKVQATNAGDFVLSPLYAEGLNNVNLKAINPQSLPFKKRLTVEQSQ